MSDHDLVEPGTSDVGYIEAVTEAIDLCRAFDPDLSCIKRVWMGWRLMHLGN